MDQVASEVFGRIVSELTRLPGVSFPKSESGQRSFGSNALKFNNRIFAMVDIQGRFVVKLPSPRVLELLDNGRGVRFEMGRARWTKEWVVLVPGTETLWPDTALEALEFVRRLNTGSPSD